MFPFPLLINNACSNDSIKSLAAPGQTGAPLLLLGHWLPRQVHWPSLRVPNTLWLGVSSSQRNDLPRFAHWVELRTPNPNSISVPGPLCTVPSLALLTVLLLGFPNPSANMHWLLCPEKRGLIHSSVYSTHFSGGSTMGQALFQAWGHRDEQAGKLPSCLTS